VSAPVTLSPTMASPTGAPGARHYRTRKALIRIIRLYQALRAGRPSPCRFWPTCSNYAAQSVERHGAGRGTLLALRRVLRCHPWGGHGFDPVPEP
jgi:putative membrane protein insertion efficiency factor